MHIFPRPVDFSCPPALSLSHLLQHVPFFGAPSPPQMAEDGSRIIDLTTLTPPATTPEGNNQTTFADGITPVIPTQDAATIRTDPGDEHPAPTTPEWLRRTGEPPPEAAADEAACPACLCTMGNTHEGTQRAFHQVAAMRSTSVAQQSCGHDTNNPAVLPADTRGRCSLQRLMHAAPCADPRHPG